MSEEKSNPSASGKSYHIGDVGSHARVQQGENLSWAEMYSNSSPDNEALKLQFNALLKRIAEHPDLDEDTRALSVEKTEAVAKSLAKAQEQPNGLKRALLEAKTWFGSTANWAWEELNKILKSEAAQKTIATITEVSTKAAIQSLIRGI